MEVHGDIVVFFWLHVGWLLMSSLDDEPPRGAQSEDHIEENKNGLMHRSLIGMASQCRFESAGCTVGR